MHINASATEKVVLFGDSLMAGYGLPKEHHLSLVLENNLKKNGLNIKVINGSVSGSTSSGGLNRAEWSLSENGIDLIILGLGANDMLRGIQPNETEKNLEGIINIANNKKIKIIIAGMIAPKSHGDEYKKNFDAIYPKLSKKYNSSPSKVGPNVRIDKKIRQDIFFNTHDCQILDNIIFNKKKHIIKKH